MIQWVKDELRAWGYAINRKPSDWPRQSIFRVIEDFGRAGPISGGKSDFVPQGIGMGKSLKAHKIISEMPYDLREVVYMKYAFLRIRDSVRAKNLGISPKTFYGRLEKAHYYYLGRARENA